jgi:hypothetical protein
LKRAVAVHVSWIDIQTARTIIFIVGLLGLALAIAYLSVRPCVRKRTTRRSFAPGSPDA